MTIAFWLSMYIVQYFVSIYVFHRIDYVYRVALGQSSGLARLFAAFGPIGWVTVVVLIVIDLITNADKSILHVLGAPERLIVSLARRNVK